MKGRPTLEFVLLLTGLLIISALPLVSALSKPQPSVNGGSDIRLALQQVHNIDRQAEELAAQARIYLDNPPREYDLYFRDAVIVHAFLNEALDRIDSDVSSLAARFEDAEPPSEAEANTEALAGRIEALEHTWIEFRSGLNEQLGVDPEMPRLEWGYEHIAERIAPVRQAIDRSTTALNERLSTSREPSAGRLPFISLAAAIVLALIALVRFRMLARE